MLETLDLYAAKSSDELIQEQAFVFDDRGGSRVVLRPELTPSLARMVAQQSQNLARPIRWWSFGPFWRYERPQKGRTREFFQWNVDFLGSNSVVADAEVASVGAELLGALGFTPSHISIRVNSRRLMESKVKELGVPKADYGKIFQLIDRMERLDEDRWTDYAIQRGLDKAQIGQLRELISDRAQWRYSEELAGFFETVDIMGTREWFEFDPQIVRGLDYYTGIVFEARDRQGELRAIFGGGRYDNLVSDVGGEPIVATGFAMGDVVVELLARRHGLVPDLTRSPAVVLVTVFDQERMSASLELARELRDAGIKSELYPAAERLTKQFKYADRKSVPLAVVLGPDEITEGKVTLKRLDTREQLSVARAEAAGAIRSVLDEVKPS